MPETSENPEPGLVVPFPIVGIGASAGGLDALRQLFSQLPADTGMAYVVIQHLDPERPSLLVSLLAGGTTMPVVEVVDGMRAEPNRIHVIPPGSDLSIHDGVLWLAPRKLTGNLHLSIDSFFRALADDQPGRAIGVVLSGSASDGTRGLRAIKAAGGITFAQEPESAQFRSMPESAIAAGVVDFRSSPAAIGRELVRLGHHPYLVQDEGGEAAPDEASVAEPDDEQSLASVLAAVRHHAQLDFRGYKRPTLMRRIARRMALRRFGSLSAYAESLRDDELEVKALGQDILIHVTSFFRDPAAFEALEHNVFAELLRRKSDDETIRIWIPGCSTGEEAYSLAIGVCECLDREKRRVDVKVFASDLSPQAIETARAGFYTESDLQRLAPERLSRYFERVDGGYRICKRIRDLCVFVAHDLTRDPPFAKLDLISCRNVLIYFDGELQRRLLPMLHHCLNKPGYLFLGGSESIGAFGELFAPLDKESRIFQKTGENRRLAFSFPFGRAEPKLSGAEAGVARRPPLRDAVKQVDQLLLSRYAPPGVVINERLEVVQFRGRTGAFLEAPPGQPQMNLLRMAREGLAAHLHEAIEAAKSKSVVVRRRGLRITEDARIRRFDLEVVPLAKEEESEQRYFLVAFIELEDEAAREAVESGPMHASTAAVEQQPAAHVVEEAVRLKAELVDTRDYLQSLLGEHQDATQELSAANEEMVSSNEELQATNEELESAKEELQATNEELGTLNDELHHRNRDLDVIATDLVNVVESVEIPMIIVDHALRIRRFTPPVRELSNLLPADIGRSIDDVRLRLHVNDLTKRIEQVIEAAELKEWEVQRLDGRWFRLQIRPYRTADGSLDGAILSFVDVDVLKRAARDAESARDYARGIVETVPTALVVLDPGLRIVSANPAFHHGFEGGRAQSEGVVFFELADGAWEVPALREAIEGSLATRSPFRELEIQRTFPGVGHRALSLSGSPFQTNEGGAMLLAIEDITERRMLETSEKDARLEAEQSNRSKDLFLATLSHELRTPLTSILMAAQVVQAVGSDDAKIQWAAAAIQRAVGNQARLIEDLLDISRIVSGKIMLDLQAVDLATIAQYAMDDARGAAAAKEIELGLAVRGEVGPVHGDAIRLQQVVANLLSNAIKFTPKGGRVTVELEAIDGRAQLAVSDTGIGIPSDALPHLFDRFVQVESSMTRAHGGLGLGLAIVRHLVQVHDGEVRAESAGEGRGAVLRVSLPIGEPGVVPAAAAPRLVARSISGVRVLLVDDDDDSREAFVMMLGALGANVRAAPSVVSGLAAVEQFRPQVILCDVAMPAEDGYSFIRKLRTLGRERGGETPAAALTALANDEDRKRALYAGFQMHLAKPIDSARLAVAVGALSVWPQ
jgi:two-component system CheB/CheR fusion protein